MRQRSSQSPSIVNRFTALCQRHYTPFSILISTENQSSGVSSLSGSSPSSSSRERLSAKNSGQGLSVRMIRFCVVQATHYHGVHAIACRYNFSRSRYCLQQLLALLGVTQEIRCLSMKRSTLRKGTLCRQARPVKAGLVLPWGSDFLPVDCPPFRHTLFGRHKRTI